MFDGQTLEVMAPHLLPALVRGDVPETIFVGVPSFAATRLRELTPSVCNPSLMTSCELAANGNSGHLGDFLDYITTSVVPQAVLLTGFSVRELAVAGYVPVPCLFLCHRSHFSPSIRPSLFLFFFFLFLSFFRPLSQSVSQSVSLSLFLSVCLSVCLSFFLSFSLSIICLTGSG